MSDRRTEDLGGPLHRLPDALRAHDRRSGNPPERPTEEAAATADAESVRPPVGSGGRIEDDGHGRAAGSATQIPAKGWQDVGVRVLRQVKEDNVGLVGAGVAFYGLLALFPALVALISLYGLLVKPSKVAEQVESALKFMPAEAREVIETQLKSITSSSKAGLGIGLAVAVLTALWSASGGLRALMTGLNIAYDETETRRFIRLRLISIALTFGVLVFVAAALAAVIGVPAAFDAHEPVGMALAWLRWPLLALLMVLGLAVLYRYGPDRDEPKWSWASAGAAIATVLWLGMTAAFSFYVSSFSKFQKTYGTFAGIIVLLTWLSLSAYVVLLGAEINAELERQTAQDTTKGPDRPIGATAGRSAAG